jgi:hypothetical protein
MAQASCPDSENESMRLQIMKRKPRVTRKNVMHNIYALLLKNIFWAIQIFYNIYLDILSLMHP